MSLTQRVISVDELGEHYREIMVPREPYMGGYPNEYSPALGEIVTFYVLKEHMRALRAGTMQTIPSAVRVSENHGYG